MYWFDLTYGESKKIDSCSKNENEDENRKKRPKLPSSLLLDRSQKQNSDLKTKEVDSENKKNHNNHTVSESSMLLSSIVSQVMDFDETPRLMNQAIANVA